MNKFSLIEIRTVDLAVFPGRVRTRSVLVYRSSRSRSPRADSQRASCASEFELRIPTTVACQDARRTDRAGSRLAISYATSARICHVTFYTLLLFLQQKQFFPLFILHAKKLTALIFHLILLCNWLKINIIFSR